MDAVLPAWLAHAQGLGEQIRVNLDDRSFSGTFLGIDRYGRLELEMADGKIETVATGDVFFPERTGENDNG